MYKYAVGAQMVQPQQTNSQDPIDQIAQIAAGSLQGDENSKQQLIQVLSNKEIAPKLLQIVDAGVKNQDKRAIIIAQAIKSLQQGSTRKARLGAKLDYIKQSNQLASHPTQLPKLKLLPTILFPIVHLPIVAVPFVLLLRIYTFVLLV